MISTLISRGLAFGRLGRVGVDGRLTGLSSFFSLRFPRACPGREEENQSTIYLFTFFISERGRMTILPNCHHTLGAVHVDRLPFPNTNTECPAMPQHELHKLHGNLLPAFGGRSTCWSQSRCRSKLGMADVTPSPIYFHGVAYVRERKFIASSFLDQGFTRRAD